MAARISKSAVDWARFASLIPKCDQGNFNSFKARSDGYLMKVLSNPEKAPELDWTYYKQNIQNKEVLSKLEAAYKALQIPYPKDTVSASIDDQEKRSKAEYEMYVKISNEKIKEAEDLLHKFKVMIPYEHMLCEDFEFTFPDWCVSRAEPSIEPHYERSPGISKELRAELAKPDGPPYSIP